MAKVTDAQALKEWRKRVDLIRKNTALQNYGTPQEQAQRIARAKVDYEYFVSYYLPHLANSKTPQFHIKTANKVKRNSNIAAWLKWGRGLAKSVVADVTIPLWLWLNNETKFFLLIGQNEDKAKILLDDLMLQFEGNQRLIHDFGVQKNIGHWESGFFITKNGFIAKAMGMGQEPRGLRVGAYRPDLITCDDWETKETLKNPKRQNEYGEWLLRSIIPTMDGERERVLLAQNQFAPTMIFSKIVTENKGWVVIEQKAFDSATLLPLWAEKYKPNYFKKRIQVMGLLGALAEYNNEPHIEGKIFTDEQIQWGKIPNLNHFDALIGQWDVAYAGTPTSDYNAIRIWGLYKGNKYLVDCYVKQSKIKPALEWIAQKQIDLPKTVSIPFRFEAQFWNDEIYRTIEEVQTAFKITLNLSKSERSKKKKYDRILEMQPQYQNGRVYYNEALKSHNDTKVGLSQLKAIEPGYSTHDDAPDADKDAFDYLDAYNRNSGHTHRVKKRENRRF